MIHFINHQDYEKTYNQLISSDYVLNFLSNKSKQQQATLKEHVSHSNLICTVFILFYEIKNKYFKSTPTYNANFQVGILMSIDVLGSPIR